MEESTKEAALREEEISAHEKLLEGFLKNLESEMKKFFRHSTLLSLTKNVSGLGQETEFVGKTLPPHQVKWNPPGVCKLIGASKNHLSVSNSQLSRVHNYSISQQDLTSMQKDKAESANCINTNRKRGRNLVVESSGRADIEMVLLGGCNNSHKKFHVEESESFDSDADPTAEDSRIRQLENEVKRLERESFEITKYFDDLKKENSTLILAVGEAKKEEVKAKLEAIEVKSREANLIKEIEELKRQVCYHEGMVKSFKSVFKAMFFKNGLDDYPPIGQSDISARGQGCDPHEGQICLCPEKQMESMSVTEKTKITPHNTDFEANKDEIHTVFTSSKEHPSSCLASQKTNGILYWTPKKISEEVFHDFNGDRSPAMFQPCQIWAIYNSGLPNRYAQIQKIEYDPFVLHVQLLEPFTIQPLCCGIFKVQTGKVFHSESSFSHLVEAESISENIFKIYPKKGEVWAIDRNWKADFSYSDIENRENDIVEIVDDTEQCMEVSLLVRVSGFKSVFRVLRGGSNMLIPRSDFGRFCHKIPAFQLAQEKEGKLRGYWELDPAAVPEVMEGEELILQSNNEFDDEIPRLEDISELMIEEGNINFGSDIIPSNEEGEPQLNESVDASTCNVGNVFETEEVFQSRSALLEWCQNTGRTVNTVVITTKSEKGSNLRKPKLFLGCERSGIYRNHSIIKNTSRREFSTRKCNCPFMLKGIFLGEDKWKLKVLCGYHNHELPNTLVGNPYAGRLGPEETKVVAELSASGMKPKKILETLKRRNGTNLSTMKTIYNAKAKIKQMNLKNENSLVHP